MPLNRAGLALLACLSTSPALAAGMLKVMHAGGVDLLGADEAFQVLPLERRGKSIHVEWNIAPGYFLYRDRLHVELVTPTGLKAGTLALPSGEPHADEHGTVTIYRGILDADLPLTGAADGPIRLRLRYQGCADAGVCYPPQVRELALEQKK